LYFFRFFFTFLSKSLKLNSVANVSDFRVRVCERACAVKRIVKHPPAALLTWGWKLKQKRWSWRLNEGVGKSRVEVFEKHFSFNLTNLKAVLHFGGKNL